MQHDMHPSDLSFDEARHAFVRLGAPNVPSDPDELKHVRNRLIRRYHESGSTPDEHKLALLIAAYRVLLNGQEPEEPFFDTESPRDWQVFGCDGSVLLPGSLVRCTTRQFKQVARTAAATLRQGFRRPWAVLLQERGVHHQVVLIFARGYDVQPALPIPVDARGPNPMLDRFLPQRVVAAANSVVPAA